MKIQDIFNGTARGVIIALVAAAVIFIECVVVVELLLNDDAALAVSQIIVCALTYKPLRTWYDSHINGT